jgi:hypothetical protein
MISTRWLAAQGALELGGKPVAPPATPGSQQPAAGCSSTVQQTRQEQSNTDPQPQPAPTVVTAQRGPISFDPVALTHLQPCGNAGISEGRQSLQQTVLPALPADLHVFCSRRLPLLQAAAGARGVALAPGEWGLS